MSASEETKEEINNRNYVWVKSQNKSTDKFDIFSKVSDNCYTVIYSSTQDDVYLKGIY